MFGYLKKKLSTMVVSLRFSILSIFITIFLVVILTLVSVFYFHVFEIVKRAAFLMMGEVSYAVLDELNLHLRPQQAACEFTAKNIRHGVLNPRNMNDMIAYFVHLLKEFPMVESIYWAGEDGNYIYLEQQKFGHYFVEIIDRTAAKAVAMNEYLDNQHRVLNRVTIPLTIDPRQQEWFKLATKMRRTVWTHLHVRKGMSAPGVTVASPAIRNDGTLEGVVAMDVSLAYLSSYVRQQKIGEQGMVFILDSKDRVISSSSLSKKIVYPTTVASMGIPVLTQSVDTFRNKHEAVFSFKESGQTYFASFKLIPILADEGWMIAIVDSANDFTHIIYRIEIIYLVLDFFIFFLGIVLMSHLVSRIVDPIKALVKETEQIKDFHLEETGQISSRIKEVIDLSNAIQSMKTGLRSFQQFVPAGLVRQLIQTGQGVHMGGAKREIAIFFSDIKDFTTITEKTESNQLVEQISDYFDSFTHSITENQGTIDKYIGDAIMAFWGAPLAVEHPCQAAARTALICLERLTSLNARWVNAGKARLLTRIGIHYGEAIVGNIGSSERLNYTALGDTVNIASRLVNANKLYGTSILVTEPVYNQIKAEFILRLVDRVVFKGKLASVAIYELIAESKHRILFDIEAYRRLYAQAYVAYQQENWSQAIEFFNACLKLYPDDTLAPVFIARCERFMVTPPPPGWDGTWYFSEK